MTTKQIVVLALAAVVIAASGFGCRVYETSQFVKGGYCQGTVQGRSDVVWVKCQEAK